MSIRSIKQLGVIGAGTMGSALAQKFAQEGFQVILSDRTNELVDKGIEKIKNSFDEALQKNVFTHEQVRNFVSKINKSSDLNDLKNCDLLIEAIYEDFQAKTDLFKNLSAVLSSDTIIATNTSSFSVNELAGSVLNPERFIGLHYFYHAAKNRLVEIIPGKKTSQETIAAIKRFSIVSGKDAIFTKDTYGFAVNRFFVPWLNEAVKIFDEGIADKGSIDAICKKSFGIGMGPFALMNATGIPIAMHAEKTLEHFGPSYKTSEKLITQAESKENWIVEDILEEDIPAEIRNNVNERMKGVTFFVCTEILNEKVCSTNDLNKGARIGLKWENGPADMMMKTGVNEVKRLIYEYANIYGSVVPDINEAIWIPELVDLEIINSNAIITINRPADMNALNENVLISIEKKFIEAESNPLVKKIFLTGSGKAFVAGADIRFFLKNMKPEKISNIRAFTEYGQKVFKRIDESKKRVIAIVNGLALGGGLELALCADTILVLPKAAMAFPETGIGIYPGLGGTQRCALKIGKGLSKYLIHTGKMISSEDAVSIGLAEKIISFDEMFALFSGEMDVPEPEKLKLNEKWRHLEEFFTENSIHNIINLKFKDHILEKAEAEKIARSISFKAPLAVKYADILIDEARGCESELRFLDDIFSSQDAFLGLNSIGKKIDFQGK